MKRIEEIRIRESHYPSGPNSDVTVLLAHIDSQAAEISALRAACEKVIETEAELWVEAPQGYPSGVYPEEQSLSKLRLAMKCCRAALADASRGEGQS